MILDNLKEVSEDYLGAVDNTTPYICKHSSGASLSDILNGKIDQWYWESVSVDEAEDMNPIKIMFVKHIEINPNRNNPAWLNILGANKKSNRFKAAVSISGILIDTTLFLQDKYKTENFDLGSISTHDVISINRELLNMQTDSYYLVGRFDLRSCTYFCKWC